MRFLYFSSANQHSTFMPSDFTVNIYCPKPKLIIFAEALYGQQPLIIPRKDNLNRLINILLRTAPRDYKPTDYGNHNLQVQLPYYEDKDVRSWYFLSDRAQHTVVNRFDDLFTLEFRRHVDKMLLLGVKTQKDSIYSFIEKYNLPEDIVSDLLKDYQRYRNVIASRQHRKRVKNREFEEHI